jgi:hypothetical protein
VISPIPVFFLSWPPVGAAIDFLVKSRLVASTT